MSYDRSKYAYWCYDQYLSLKPPLLLVLAIVFLCRGILLPLLALLTSMKGSGDLAALLSGEHAGAAALGALPASLVLYALIRRSPSAGWPARWGWRNGRLLLALAALIDAYAAAMLLHFQVGSSDDFLTLPRLILDADALIYVLAAKRVRDSFTDFPVPMER